MWHQQALRWLTGGAAPGRFPFDVVHGLCGAGPAAVQTMHAADGGGVSGTAPAAPGRGLEGHPPTAQRRALLLHADGAEEGALHAEAGVGAPADADGHAAGPCEGPGPGAAPAHPRTPQRQRRQRPAPPRRPRPGPQGAAQSRSRLVHRHFLLQGPLHATASLHGAGHRGGDVAPALRGRGRRLRRAQGAAPPRHQLPAPHLAAGPLPARHLHRPAQLLQGRGARGGDQSHQELHAHPRLGGAPVVG